MKDGLINIKNLVPNVFGLVFKNLLFCFYFNIKPFYAVPYFYSLLKVNHILGRIKH